MERFRIGNDLTIFWAIKNRDGSPFSLEGKTIKLFLVHPKGKTEVTEDIIVKNNVIRWLYRGINQRYLGNYRLIAEIYSGPGKRAIRRDEHTFALVSSSKCEKIEKGEANIVGQNELFLSSVLDVYHIDPVIPYIGENGNWWIDGQDTGKPSSGGGSEGTAYTPNYLKTSWLEQALTEESLRELSNMAGENFDTNRQNLQFSTLGRGVNMTYIAGNPSELMGTIPINGILYTFRIPLEVGVVPYEAMTNTLTPLSYGPYEIPNTESFLSEACSDEVFDAILNAHNQGRAIMFTLGNERLKLESMVNSLDGERIIILSMFGPQAFSRDGVSEWGMISILLKRGAVPIVTNSRTLGRE